MKRKIYFVGEGTVNGETMQTAKFNQIINPDTSEQIFEDVFQITECADFEKYEQKEDFMATVLAMVYAVLSVEGEVGEEITLRDLLYGLMLRSGNDAAITLAISVSKSVDSFVNLMNKKADELGLKGTYFNNPHGLDEQDDGNISTAYDMAVLYSYCLKNELFAKITQTTQYKTYINKNRLVRTYSYCTGGKTGFTKKAKRTLVTSASKDNINLIVVTLNCGSDFKSHQDIYESYFNTHKSIKILNKGENSFNNVVFNPILKEVEDKELLEQIEKEKHTKYLMATVHPDNIYSM